MFVKFFLLPRSPSGPRLLSLSLYVFSFTLGINGARGFLPGESPPLILLAITFNVEPARALHEIRRHFNGTVKFRTCNYDCRATERFFIDRCFTRTRGPVRRYLNLSESICRVTINSNLVLLYYKAEIFFKYIRVKIARNNMKLHVTYYSPRMHKPLHKPVGSGSYANWLLTSRNHRDLNHLLKIYCLVGCYNQREFSEKLFSRNIHPRSSLLSRLFRVY